MILFQLDRRGAFAVALCLAGSACGGDDDGGAQGSDSGSNAEGTSQAEAPDAGADGADESPTEDGDGPAESGEPSPSPDCDTPLTQWEQMMLDSHNAWRAAVEPSAADMHRVYWDTEIAQSAAAWVSSCDPDWPHSPEESRAGVGGYEVLGENLSYCAGTGCGDDPTITDGSGKGDAIGWWDERHDYNWADDSSSGVTSHYTQMVSSNVYAIGCATQLCSAPGPYDWDGQWWWTICQYGPRGDAYWVGNKPYQSGQGGLLDLPASVFDEHPGLCGP